MLLSGTPSVTVEQCNVYWHFGCAFLNHVCASLVGNVPNKPWTLLLLWKQMPKHMDAPLQPGTLEGCPWTVHDSHFQSEQQGFVPPQVCNRGLQHSDKPQKKQMTCHNCPQNDDKGDSKMSCSVWHPKQTMIVNVVAHLCAVGPCCEMVIFVMLSFFIVAVERNIAASAARIL